MSQYNFVHEDIVWAKMKGFSAWPAIIRSPAEPKIKKGHMWVYFFGSHNYANILEGDLKPYVPFRGVFTQNVKNASFRAAIEEAEDLIRTRNPGEAGDAAFDALFEEPAASPPVKKDMDERRPEKKVEEKAEKKPEKRKRISESNAHQLNKRRIAASTMPNIDRHPTEILPPTRAIPRLRHDFVRDVVPTKLRIGFIGAGRMGKTLIENLLKVGHRVSVWNRTTEKCDSLVDKGAKTESTPSDVASQSDIIFICVSDGKTAKELIFGNCGAIDELEGKSLVDLSSLDPESSWDICEGTSLRNARYLEVQFQGGLEDAEKGELFALVAGDPELFVDAKSCLECFSNRSIFLGEVGNAVKFNLLINYLKAVNVAALSECMEMIEKCGLQTDTFLTILDSSPLNSPLIQKKLKIMRDQELPHVERALKYVQQDLRNILTVSDSCEQPMPLAATANEIYKQSRRKGYGPEDYATVHFKRRIGFFLSSNDRG